MPIDTLRSGLAFRRLTNLSLSENVAALPWADLHEERSKLKKGLESILAVAEKEKRGLTGDEVLAFEFGESRLDDINRVFDIRSEHGTKEPVLVQRKPPGLAFSGVRGGDTGEYESLNDFMLDVLSARHSPKLERRAVSVADGEAGGYMVPEAWLEGLMTPEEGSVRSFCRLFPMNTAVLHVPLWDMFTHDSGLFKNVVAEWKGELASTTEVTPATRALTFTARKLVIYTSASREWMADVPNGGAQLAEVLRRSIGWYLDRSIVCGSLAYEPAGILNSQSAITVSRVAANSVGLTDLKGMLRKIAPSVSGQGVVWLAHPSIRAELIGIEDTGGHALWSANAAGPLPGQLFGYPVIFTEHASTLGSRGDLALCNLQTYGLALRQDLIIDRSDSALWSTDAVAMRAIVRADGASLWPTSMTLADGTEVSNVVVLDVP